MELTTSAQSLAAALKPLTALSGRASTLPVLSCVLLEASDAGQLLLTGTDTNSRLGVELPADAVKPGSCCVNAVHLLGIASRVQGSLDMALSGDLLTIRHEGGIDKLQTLPAQEFPAAPERIGAELALELPVADMVGQLSAVKPCICTDAARPNLCGVQMESDGNGTLVTVATTGKVIAVSTLAVNVPAFSLFIDTSSADLMLKSLEGRDGTAHLVISESLIELAAPGLQASFARSSHTFPNWRNTVPDYSGRNGLEIERAGLLNGLNSASWAIGEGAFSGVKLTSTGKSLDLLISREADTATRAVPAKGPKWEVHLNADALIRALRSHKADKVKLTVADAMSAVLIESDGLVHVMMPLRFS